MVALRLEVTLVACSVPPSAVATLDPLVESSPPPVSVDPPLALREARFALTRLGLAIVKALLVKRPCWCSCPGCRTVGLDQAMASSDPWPMEEAGRGVVYSSFEVGYPVEEEERRTSEVTSSMRKGSVEQVNTHRDLRSRAVVKV